LPVLCHLWRVQPYTGVDPCFKGVGDAVVVPMPRTCAWLWCCSVACLWCVRVCCLYGVLLMASKWSHLSVLTTIPLDAGGTVDRHALHVCAWVCCTCCPICM
jgi:hypothetical protein